MESFVETQFQIKEGIDQLLRNFKKDSHERKTSDYIRRKLETLENYWKEFQSNHLQLCGVGDKNHCYFTNNEYQYVSDLYNQAKQAIQGYQVDGSRPSTPILKPPTFQINPHGVPLPKTNTGTNSRLDEMLRKQTSNFRAFSRSVSNIDMSVLTDRWEYEDALKTLHSRWAVIDSLHWEIDSELNGENAAYEAEYAKYERSFHHIKKVINTKMFSVAHRDKSTPQMEIPHFSSSYQQWTSFRDLFVAAIHNNPSLSSAQKLQFLKSKLRGESEKLIQHLNISSDNYQVAWDILNHRYNNKKLIFTSHLNALLNLPTLQAQTSGGIKRLHDTTNECLHAIEKLGVDISTWDPIVVHLLSQKLDAESHNDYIESLSDPRELPTLKDFLKFLEIKFTSLEVFRRKQEPAKPTQDDPYFKKTFNRFSTHKQLPKPPTKPAFKSLHVEKKSCPHCKENHPIFLCKAFRESRSDVKQKTISKYNLCHNCLFDHQGKECLSDKTCRYCNLKHNSLLHELFFVSKDIATTSKLETNQKKCHVSQENIAETLLATAMVNVQAADGTYHTIRALIDQGSQTSLISENTAQLLGLPRQRCKGVIFGVGAKENNCKGVVNVKISSLDNSFSLNTDAFIMKNVINKLPNQTFKKPSWQYLDSIELADPHFYISRPVDILLGAEVYSSIILSGIIKIGTSIPVAQETEFGYILSGNVKTFHCNVVINDTDKLQKFWNIEDIADSSPHSDADNYCIQFYTSTTKRLVDGRYSVSLPLKPGFQEKLGTSKPMAVAQFRQLERKFQKNNLFAQNYKLFINEYRTLGHMILSATGNPRRECYLPHHGIFKNESTTTPLRVVFNSSAKTSTGYSLNDLMEVGPNLQQDLQSLLLKWRQYQYAFTADIEKMFRQIKINEDDQKYQKIIWRDNPQSTLEEYQLTTVTYGTKAAPFLAMMTLKRLAMDEEPNYQHTKATTVLQESFYMDDLLHGCHSIPEGKELQTDLINLLKSGGFNLRKWKSNATELLPYQNTNDDQFSFKQAESTKTLGLRWNPKEDTFTFLLTFNKTTPHFTKRSLLSDVSKVFDPLGWLSPVTTKLKILFQTVWTIRMEWDDLLPEDLNAEWMKARAELEQINQIQLPRWIGTRKNCTLEIHGLCDASTKAYACAIYVKITIDDTTSVNLLTGKTRLVPVSKTITLPRLELCGAHLLAKLMKKVKDCLQDYNLKVYGWSDSTAVLGWLHGDTNRWKPFVANRVKQTTEVMPSDCWRYVKSEENSADCASRGVSASQLEQHHLCWHGPKWLASYHPENEQQKQTFSTDQEVRKIKHINP